MTTGKQKSDFLKARDAALMKASHSSHSFTADPVRAALNGDVTQAGTQVRNPEPFVDAEEAGRFLQLQRRRVLQLARQGKLPAYPIGDGLRRVWRFRLSELAIAMLNSRQRSHVPEEI